MAMLIQTLVLGLPSVMVSAVSQILSSNLMRRVMSPNIQNSASIMLTGKQTCASFLATTSVAVLPQAPLTYPMKTMTSAIIMATSEATHAMQMIFLRLALKPVTICTTLVLSITMVISKLITPARMKNDLKWAVHVKLKNRNTHVRLPGPFVQRMPKSYFVKNVSRLNIMANMDQNPTNRCSTLLFAQLLASPMPSRPMIITMPDSNKLNAYAPQNILLLYDCLLNFNTRRAIKLKISSAMAMGWPADDTSVEQFTAPILLMNCATSVCRASWKNRRWLLKVRITG